MPAIRATCSARTSQGSPANSRLVHSPSVVARVPHGQAEQSLGPLADQDPLLKGHNKTSANEINKARLREAVAFVAPPRPKYALKSHKPGHRLSPTLNLCCGISNPSNIGNVGRWYQLVRRSILALT